MYPARGREVGLGERLGRIDADALGAGCREHATKTLNQCRFLSRFFEATNFYLMEPHDELARRGMKLLLADVGRNYIAYAEQGPEPLGIKNFLASSYVLTWLDCENGR